MSFRVVFMGSQEFSVPSLERLAGEGFRVEAVVTRPDRPAGRGRKLSSTPVKIKAETLRIRCLEPESVKNPELRKQLQEIAPDFFVVAAYGGILPGDILRIPKRAALGIHPSLLPLYRGANPIRWALARGETETGVTIFELAEGIDTGNIILQQPEPILSEDNFGSLSLRLARVGADLLLASLGLYLRGEVSRKAQPGPATEAPMFLREQEKIDWTRPAAEIADWIRALSPAPGAFTFLSGKRLKILAARARPAPPESEPGTLVSPLPGEPGFGVACGEGVLELLIVQLEGGKSLPLGDFLRGHPLKVGERIDRHD